MIGSQSGSVMSVTSTSPRLNAIHLADIVDHLDRTGANAVADGAPFGDDLPLSVEGITLHHPAAGTHGFRTRPDDK